MDVATAARTLNVIGCGFIGSWSWSGNRFGTVGISDDSSDSDEVTALAGIAVPDLMAIT